MHAWNALRYTAHPADQLVTKNYSDDEEGSATVMTALDKTRARVLTAEDRCDRCAARAVVETVMMGGGSLLWCGHHFGRYEDSLDALGAAVIADSR
jgi:hypothetical protein